MTRIIENIKENGLILLFGIIVIFATMLPMGCANMYDENGNLTAETVEDYKYGEETATAIVSTVAPQYNWPVGADNAPEIIKETQTEQPEQVAQVEQYIPDVPQLAKPLKPRTAHFAFRRGRI